MSKQEFERAKEEISWNTVIWFYTNDIELTYEELTNKGEDITPTEKQE